MFLKGVSEPMDKLTKAVKDISLKLGADMVGIGFAEAMNREAREMQKPDQNLPGTKAVVSFGLKMPNSIFKTSNIRISRTSYVYLHEELDNIAWKVVAFLEERGFDAIPIPSAVPVEMMKRGGSIRRYFPPPCSSAGGIEANRIKLQLLTSSVRRSGSPWKCIDNGSSYSR